MHGEIYIPHRIPNGKHNTGSDEFHRLSYDYLRNSYVSLKMEQA